MTQPIDTAYVDIVARDKSLDTLRKDINNTMDQVEKDVKKDLDKIDKDFDNTFDNINSYMDDMLKTAKTDFAKLTSIAESSADAIDQSLDRVFNSTQHHFTEMGDDAHSTFKKIRDKLVKPLEAAFDNVNDVVKNIVVTLSQFGSGIGSIVSSSPLLALIIALTPAIIALAAALSQLIGVVGLIPAGFAVLLTAIIPVVVAFQNFGEAVSAFADGDIDKINEALKKLSPSAASVAREIGAMLPQLRAFQRFVQEAFFKQIQGDFTRTFREIFPTMEKGFVDVASAMGKLVSSFADLLGSKSTIQTFQEIFATTVRIIDRLSPSFIIFSDMLLNTVHEALPFVERLSGAFGRALDAFSAFVNKSIETGDFDQFIEDAITTIKELIDLVKALGGLLGTLFAGTEDSGHDFIIALTEMTTKLNEFLKSAEGQDAITLLVVGVKILGVAIQTTLDLLIFFFSSSRNFLLFLEKVGRGFIDLVIVIGEWLGKVPGYVTDFIGKIPAMVAGFFQSMIDQALQVLGIGIGLILFTVFELPKQIIAAIQNLPQRIYELLVGVGPIIVNIFQGAVDFAKNLIVNGFNEIVEFIQSVPGRIRNLIPNFSSAGHSLIESFMNGFRKVGNFIGDIAGDIVGAVKGFLNKAIDKINQGIAKVDLVLPGDLGRIPRLEDGAFVPRRPGGILANIGEGKEDEWVLPQSKLEAMTGAGQTITFGPSAINVNFSGAVPTEKEARDTGAAVGQGVIDMITKRNMRVQVRAI
jgi:phage-related protein